MPKIAKLLAAAFPQATIRAAEALDTFIVESPDFRLRVQMLQMPSDPPNDLGSFKNMTARPGVD